MDGLDSFSADYGEARSKFRLAAAEAGAQLDRIAHPLTGPRGEDLSVDVAWLGPREAERILVTFSAVHGVEGFCGSGAQVDWLRRGEGRDLPADVAVMHVHAVNPYGFAWLRRMTEENVDLNRNWIDFAAERPRNPGYEALADVLNPADWSPESQARTRQVMTDYGREHGPSALVEAASGGQYVDPKGIFYGGDAPVWAQRTLTRLLCERLQRARRVAVIDFHTGLGPWGYGEPIIVEGPGDPAYARARDWFGAAITSMAKGEAAISKVSGDTLEGVPRLLRHAEVACVALEFGTLPGPKVLNAIRADNWLHVHGDPAGPEAVAIKAEIRAAFYGDRPDWKGMILGQALATSRQALSGLAAD